MMKKISLELDELWVESFEVSASYASERHTVEGHALSITAQRHCSGDDAVWTCKFSCKC